MEYIHQKHVDKYCGDKTTQHLKVVIPKNVVYRAKSDLNELKGF